MKFARRVYLIAAIYGFLVLGPMYFLEGKISRDTPPAITHPEFFYGFVGLGLAWQVLFAIVASDTIRFRPIMWPTLLEKFLFAFAVVALVIAGRTSPTMLWAAAGDFIFGVLFVMAIVATSGRREQID